MVDISKKVEWKSTDAWRGYGRPYYAVAGSSDTGMWEDSPARSDLVDKEIKELQQYLTRKGIKSKLSATESSNVFMVKRWIVVANAKFEEAKKLVAEYLNTHETQYIHD